jgi:exopolysaccharide biosynthesis polyprenyl glycosylphosphotransferase
MFPALAILEAAALFAVACGGLLPRSVAPEQALVLCLCWVAASYYNDLYDFGIMKRLSDFAARLPWAAAWGLLLLAILWFLFPGARIDAGTFGLIVGVTAAIALLLRAACHAVLRCRPFRERVLILGTGPVAIRIAQEIESRPYLCRKVIGFVGESAHLVRPPAYGPWLGGYRDIDRIIQETEPDRVIVALAERRGRVPVRQLVELRMTGVAIDDGEEVYEQLTGTIALAALAPSSLIFGRSSGKSRLHFAIARTMSLSVSAIALALTAPLFPLIALAIRLESPGPIFYVQDRVGLRGRRFRILKFRTMRPTERERSLWAGDNGDRITRVGTWLRKFRLDELPQFVNILRGDMNLVGPRPHPVSNYRLFAASIPHYPLRLTVRPGVTGWAQTRHGYANNLHEETEKMRYDLYYIKHASPWLDLRIMFDTLNVILMGRRSEPGLPLPSRRREGRPARAHDTAA